MATIRLEGVAKRFAGHAAVAGVDLEIAEGEFLVLVGPSGCGKSTLLRLIAGLEQPTAGSIALDGTDVTNVAPQHRDVAMVFQSYALYPHMSVRDNLGYGLKVRRVDRGTIARDIGAVATALGIEGLLDRRPAQLSGGERQRVALGRAIVRKPRAFLLDEPLSNLDPSLRAQARAELRRLHRSLGATVVYVTHDQEEAMTLGTRVAVMRGGRLEQVGPPLDVYARPANTFVARFIGAPPMNLVPGALALPGAPADATAGIRPHDVVVGEGPLRATVDVVEPRGHDHVVHLRLDAAGALQLVAVVAGPAPAAGTTVLVALPAGHVHVFDGHGRRLDGGPG